MLDVTTARVKVNSLGTEVVDVYPNPEVSLVTDNDVCVGTDWEGLGRGFHPFVDQQHRNNPRRIDDNGSLFLNLPWSEIGVPTDGSVPVPFLLDVASDYTWIQCSSTWELTLDVLQNPEVNITSTGRHLCGFRGNLDG